MSSPSSLDPSLPPAVAVADRLPSSESDDREAVWLREVYRPDEPNLTVRAVIAGILIGAVMCLSNIYVFFKTGWSLGVTITACILAFATFKGLQGLGIVKRPLGALENNALTTVASGAGYMTAGGNAAAFGALVMITTVEPNKIGLVAWFAIIAALGVFAAIPIKRQLINREGLPFPTGTATAETLKTIHSTRAGEGTSAAKALGLAGLLAGSLTVARDVLKWIPASWAPGIQILGHDLARWTFAIKTEVVLLGAGALMSFRTGWSLLLGSVITYVVIAPALFERGLIHEVSYTGIAQWALWPGAAILVGAGLMSFALDYKSIARAFSGMGSILGGRKRVSVSTLVDGGVGAVIEGVPVPVPVRS